MVKVVRNGKEMVDVCLTRTLANRTGTAIKRKAR
jgi:hypothetical protein